MNARVTQSRSDATRRKILEVAADHMYRVGFQSASLKLIVAESEISKGCLYHHFASKHELGYAVLDELFAAVVAERWKWVANARRPLEAIVETLERSIDEVSGDALRFGCPIANLAQEMSPLDEGFRRRVEAVHEQWRRWLVAGLQRAKDQGDIVASVEPASIASLIIAGAQGAKGLAKSAQDSNIYREAIDALVTYLRSLQE